jgi:Ca2+-binding EF-hand superfamily protein
MSAMPEALALPSEERIRQAFAVFGMDRTGSLDRNLMSDILQRKSTDKEHLSCKAVDALLARVDTDNSGEFDGLVVASHF